MNCAADLRDDRLYGVIELATFHDLADHELDFLNKSREAIAIAIAVAESRRRVDALLSETQQQAEKLQVQQEQLQQSNEELEERARLLESQKRQVDAKNREIEQVSHTTAVQSRDWIRLPQPKRPERSRFWLLTCIVNLVGHQEDGLVRLAQHAHHMLIG